MSPRPFDRKKTELEVVRTNLLKQLEGFKGESDEYRRTMDNVETLSNLIDKSQREKLSPNTIAVVLGNFGIAGLVLWYERENVINTKLFSFVGKNRG